MSRTAPYSHADGSNCWTKNCSRRTNENALRESWQKAIQSSTPEEIKTARRAYLMTESGVNELRAAGKDKLANAYAQRRRTKFMRDRKAALSKKQPITLALDLDQTTGDFIGGFRDYLAKEEGLTPEQALAKYPEPKQYNLVKAGWFKNTDEFLNRFHAAEKNGLYRNLKAFNGAQKTLMNLVNNKDVKVVVVTARAQKWNADTKAWLKTHRIPATRIIHTEDKEKVQNIDVYIDDSDKQLKTLSSHGRTVIAFHNLYNEHVNVQNRVKKWSQVPAVLKRMKEGS